MAITSHISALTLTALTIVITQLLFTSSAATASTPETIDVAKTVSAEEFINLAGRAIGLVIVDSRIVGDRKLGFVEGSINLPNVNTTCESLNRILAEENTPVLFYCNGIKCGRSAKAIKIASACGYTNIYWFRGGFEEWLAKGYPYLQQ